MSSELIQMTVPEQEQANWCWAATTVGISDYYNPPMTPEDAIKQCDVVNRRLKRSDCCFDGASDLRWQCNVQSGLTLPLFELGHHVVTYANQLDFETIASEVAQGRPVCCRVVWEEGFGEGHFVVIVGVIHDSEGGITDVVVEDSFYGRSIQTYGAFRRFYRVPLQNGVGDDIGEGLWTHSYFTQKSEVEAGCEAAA
ncbi:MAG: papain-like cysteine protease family protein [Paracoccaceae bacterium]|nr:papain-like cysteine protease family protein [Paracoccaceae bacterium]